MRSSKERLGKCFSWRWFVEEFGKEVRKRSLADKLKGDVWKRIRKKEEKDFKKRILLERRPNRIMRGAR